MKNKAPQKYQNPVQIEDVKNQKHSIKVEKHSYYEGPLPHPETLAQFKMIDESFPNRIMTVFEQETIDRRKKENKIINYGLTTQIISSISALAAVSMICFLGYLFMEKGYADEAKYIICTVVIGLAAVFFGKRIFKEGNKKEE